MTIYRVQNPASQRGLPSAQHVQPVDIEAWAEQATEDLLRTTSSVTSAARGTSVIMTIPFDDITQKVTLEAATRQGAIKAAYVPPRVPMRRDSLKRREALLRGNEGSRRRQRWENGLFLPHYSIGAVCADHLNGALLTLSFVQIVC